MYTIQLASHDVREKLRMYLSKRGITCKVYFDPVHKSKYYMETIGIRANLPVTEDIQVKFSRCQCIPHFQEKKWNIWSKTFHSLQKNTSYNTP